MTKIDYQIHDVLIKAMRSPFQSVEEVKGDLNAFIESFKPYEDKVLKLIEKYTGYPFQHDRIPVYLVPASPNSIPRSNAKSELEDGLSGIVQKIVPDMHRNYHIFIHELTHVNHWHNYDELSKSKYFRNEDGTKNIEGVELAADIIALQIIRDIYGNDSDIEKNFWDFLENTHEINKRKGEMLKEYIPQWDLTQKPLIEYIF